MAWLHRPDLPYSNSNFLQEGPVSSNPCYWSITELLFRQSHVQAIMKSQALNISSEAEDHGTVPDLCFPNVEFSMLRLYSIRKRRREQGLLDVSDISTSNRTSSWDTHKVNLLYTYQPLSQSRSTMAFSIEAIIGLVTLLVTGPPALLGIHCYMRRSGISSRNSECSHSMLAEPVTMPISSRTATIVLQHHMYLQIGLKGSLDLEANSAHFEWHGSEIRYWKVVRHLDVCESRRTISL